MLAVVPKRASSPVWDSPTARKKESIGLRTATALVRNVSDSLDSQRMDKDRWPVLAAISQPKPILHSGMDRLAKWRTQCGITLKSLGSSKSPFAPQKGEFIRSAKVASWPNLNRYS